jgi:pyruvate dehydrogenase E2 component (dihydrolipoamide acetyltransferase)
VTTRIHGWRKLAGASWRAPTDPQFYGDLDIDAASLLSYLDLLRRRHGVHATVTHAVVRATAHALTVVPQLNVRLTHGHERARSSIDVLVIVAAADNELTGIKICNADQKSLVDVAVEVDSRVGAIRSGTDREFGKTKKTLTRLPRQVLRPAVRTCAWLTSDLNLDLGRFGLPRQAFGSAMVSSIGMTGITHAYSPLASYYRVPFLILVGAVAERPAVRSGHVVARPMLTLTATFDHRYADGRQAAELARAAQQYLSNPSALEPPVRLGQAASASAVLTRS